MQTAEKDLQERTKRFALNIIRTFSMMPKTTEAQVLGKQLLRSGTSVGEIIARPIGAAARQNRASGTSDMHGNALRVAGVSREVNE